MKSSSARKHQRTARRHRPVPLLMRRTRDASLYRRLPPAHRTPASCSRERSSAQTMEMERRRRGGGDAGSRGPRQLDAQLEHRGQSHYLPSRAE